MSQPLEIGSWVFSAKTHSTAISPDRETVYSFDLEGRPISWFEEGRVFKRSLASEVHGRQKVEGERQRWVVPREAAAESFGRLLARVAEAPADELPEEFRQRLADILRWTPETLLDEKERFDAAYEPIGILPPDQYFAVVLQATLGCSWNRCTFCSFYQDRPFTARPPEQFVEHVEAVRGLLGRGEKLRNRIFLADGNALILSNARLAPIFRAALDAFPDRPVNGFVDVFTGERKPVADWQELRGWGLERVYVGLESGYDRLLLWMNKPGGGDEAREFITALKEAGLKVATILMCGAGGDRYAGEHVERTLDLMAGLPLEAGDIVYLSPFFEQPGSAYAQKALEEQVRPLDQREREEQRTLLRKGILSAHPDIKVARYDIREFIY
jgi:radical SAM superfamily enzyme YgiQ (UPF0313 family)